jgi:transcriptional regulator with XRE-family HTH domain
MIRNDNELKKARTRMTEEKAHLVAQEEALRAQGFTVDEVQELMQPFEVFLAQLVEEVEIYLRMKRGEIDDITSLSDIGRMLICLRIATGVTQRELARRLGVDEAVVSRDERNEYHNVSLEKAQKILDVLGGTIIARVQAEPMRPQRAVIRKDETLPSRSLPSGKSGSQTEYRPDVEVWDGDDCGQTAA